MLPKMPLSQNNTILYKNFFQEILSIAIRLERYMKDNFKRFINQKQKKTQHISY